MAVKQIDLAQRVIRLEPGTTKNGDGREVLMTETLFHLLSALTSGKGPDDPVFTRPDGSRVRDFRKTWANACAAADLPDLLLHDLRRTGAPNLRRAGVQESIAMKIGGWKTNSVFRRYAITDRRDLAQAIRQLEEHEKKLASAENGHSSGIVDQFEASQARSAKLQ